MALVTGGVAFFGLRTYRTFDQVYVFDCGVGRDLIVVGIIERLRKRVADVEQISDGANARGLVAEVDEQAVIPGVRVGSGDGDLIGDAGERVGDGAGHIAARAGNERRGGSGVAQELRDELALAEDVEAVGAERPVIAELLLQAD